MIKLLAIGLGGFAGAILRYWISGLVYQYSRGDFPVGTLVVNLVGSFLLGLMMTISGRILVHPTLKIAATIGILGAFTTFSTFTYETMMLINAGSLVKAIANLAVSVSIGLMAVYLGSITGKLI